jgi:hypothetical protein
MKNRWKEPKDRLLPPDWEEHLDEYVLWGRSVPRTLPSGDHQWCTSQPKTREQAIRYWWEVEVPYDASTGRAIPFNTWYRMPYCIVHIPSKSTQQMANEEDYDAYLRTICLALDKGMPVKQAIDIDFRFWLHPFTKNDNG